MLWCFASVALLALSLGCAPQPPPKSEIAPIIESALKPIVPDFYLFGTRVKKIGAYDRQRHSWPVRAATAYSYVPGVAPAPWDSVRAIYRVTRNELGEWVAKFDRFEEEP